MENKTFWLIFDITDITLLIINHQKSNKEMLILGKPSYRPWTGKMSAIPFHKYMCIYEKIGGEMFLMIPAP